MGMSAFNIMFEITGNHKTKIKFDRCTRLEIGVQSIYEDVARDTNRGHTVRAVCESFQLAKDAGFKVIAHMMPNLPNVDLARDIAQFEVRYRCMYIRNVHINL